MTFTDSPAMHRRRVQSLENEHVERALEHVLRFAIHRELPLFDTVEHIRESSWSIVHSPRRPPERSPVAASRRSRPVPSALSKNSTPQRKLDVPNLGDSAGRRSGGTLCRMTIKAHVKGTHNGNRHAAALSLAAALPLRAWPCARPRDLPPGSCMAEIHSIRLPLRGRSSAPGVNPLVHARGPGSARQPDSDSLRLAARTPPTRSSSRSRRATGGFRVEARNGQNGALIWSQATDYILPQHNWTPSYSPAITPGNDRTTPGLAARSICGTTWTRAAPRRPAGVLRHGQLSGEPGRLQRDGLVNTPITSDSAGNIYFGFQAEPRRWVTCRAASPASTHRQCRHLGVSRERRPGRRRHHPWRAAPGGSRRQQRRGDDVRGRSVGRQQTANGYLVGLNPSTLALKQ